MYTLSPFLIRCAGIPLPSRASLNELQDAVRNLLPKRSGEFYLEYDVGGGVPCVALVNPEGMRIFRESASKVTAATSNINVVIVKWRGQLVRSTPSPKEAPLSAPPSTVQRNFGMLHHFDMNHPPTKHKQHHRKHSQLAAATAVGGNEVDDNGSRVVHPNAVVCEQDSSSDGSSATTRPSTQHHHHHQQRHRHRHRHRNNTINKPGLSGNSPPPKRSSVLCSPFGGPSIGAMVEEASDSSMTHPLRFSSTRGNTDDREPRIP